MPDNSGFLETETVVHNLLEELNKLKPAVDQIEDTKNSAKTIQESANNIVRGTTELLTTGKIILERVDKVRFKGRFDEVEQLGRESVENDKTILNKIDEVRFKERFDAVEQLGGESVENDKTILNGIEDAKNSVKIIQESANNIFRSTIELLTTGKTILDRVDEIGFKERFDVVEQLGEESVENNKTILNRIDRLEKRNSRLSIGVMSLLVFQIATLVFLFLK